jgi:phosphate starvation-inducible protein PhoH and related proteins
LSTHTANQLTIDPLDNNRLASLCGQCNEHLQLIESHCDVQIHQRSNCFDISGAPDNVAHAERVIQNLYEETAQTPLLTPKHVHLYLQKNISTKEQTQALIHVNKLTIKPHGKHQAQYVTNIQNNAINFGIGPAGTGKSYLAVATAVEALEKGLIRRIILVRPAVEAGEKLGFLPGDMAEKVNPYLRPMYDFLYEIMGQEQVTKAFERDIIEIAPLAFMRGRTLNDSFIILDEAQNTTSDQMKMFLTRIGFGSTAVITGDITQVDLPDRKQSGLMHAERILKDLKGITFTYFKSEDCVRHPLVQSIIDAYDSKGDR